MSQPVASIVPVVWSIAFVVKMFVGGPGARGLVRLVVTNRQPGGSKARTPSAKTARAETERRSITLAILIVLSLTNFSSNAGEGGWKDKECFERRKFRD